MKLHGQWLFIPQWWIFPNHKTHFIMIYVKGDELFGAAISPLSWVLLWMDNVLTRSNKCIWGSSVIVPLLIKQETSWWSLWVTYVPSEMGRGGTDQLRCNVGIISEWQQRGWVVAKIHISLLLYRLMPASTFSGRTQPFSCLYCAQEIWLSLRGMATNTGLSILVIWWRWWLGILWCKMIEVLMM